uniref:Uncharacterized protein n=1 Tax=Arundo donax TaxID=35708 RepID=A0A0A9F3T7_ARUDO
MKVFAYQITQFISFLPPLFLLPDRPLMLHPDPEFVHFNEILKNKFNCIINAFSIPFVLRTNIRQFVSAYLRKVTS